MVGVSVDSVWANRAFAEQLHADYPVVSDFKHDVARTYGVYDETSGYALRTTFVIDDKGVVQKIDQSSEALDPNGAIGACPLPRKK